VLLWDSFASPLHSAYPDSTVAADNPAMTSTAIGGPRDVKSFRLAKPIAAELTVCTPLSLAASGIWLLVLPLELLRFVSA
jgi:hypothetical protein